MKPKLLITGGLGFIGTNLALELKAEYEIRILDNLSSNSENKPYIQSFAEIIEGDLLNPDDCDKAVNGVDYIVHLAAKGSVVESVTDPIGNLNANVIGTVNLLNAVKNSDIKRFVFSSTGGALMGNCELPVSEKSIPKPISPYGASKLACEGYCSAFSESFDIPITVLRFANVIGAYCSHKKGIVNVICNSLIKNETIGIFGDGCASRDYIYVKDICLGISLALTNSPSNFDTFHIGTGYETTVRELIQTFENVSGRRATIEYKERRVGEVEKNFSSYALAKACLGYEPSDDISLAINDVWSWFLKKSKE